MSSVEVWFIQSVKQLPAVWNHVTEIVLLHKLNSSSNVICREDAKLRILCLWPSVLSQFLKRRGGRVWKATGAMYIQPPMSHIHQGARHLLGISVQLTMQIGSQIHSAPNILWAFLCARHVAEGTPQNVTVSFSSGLVRDHWLKRQYRRLQALVAAWMTCIRPLTRISFLSIKYRQHTSHMPHVIDWRNKRM